MEQGKPQPIWFWHPDCGAWASPTVLGQFALGMMGSMWELKHEQLQMLHFACGYSCKLHLHSAASLRLYHRHGTAGTCRKQGLIWQKLVPTWGFGELRHWCIPCAACARLLSELCLSVSHLQTNKEAVPWRWQCQLVSMGATD